MQKIGSIIGVHGLQGEMLIQHNLQSRPAIRQWDCFRIELNPGSFVPFFISSIRLTDENCFLCKLEEVQNRDDARKLLHKNVYNSINYQVELRENHTALSFLGYTLYQEGERIGIVDHIAENHANPLMIIKDDDKEILIPAQAELIRQIDREKKILYMQLPEGLIDINQ